MGRSSLFLFAFTLLASLGCSKKDSSPKQLRSVFCYSSMERKAPGELHLSGTVDCALEAKHYRAQGPRNRPDVVDLLDEKGSVLISYRMDFDADGRVVKESRVFREKPRALNIYEMGTRYDFSSQGGDKWQQVSIVTDLDEKGRAVLVVKKVKGQVEYSMKREYGQVGLKKETVFDSDGKIRIQSEFRKEGKNIVEVMRDRKGKKILERKIQPK